MSDLGKSCMMCKHFYIDLGGRGYSEYTPGYPGSIDCCKGLQRGLGEGANARTFREWVRFGNTCPSFEGAES